MAAMEWKVMEHFEPSSVYVYAQCVYGWPDPLEVNYQHLKYCHVQWTTTPSIRGGLYRIYLLIGKRGDLHNKAESVWMYWMLGTALTSLKSMCRELASYILTSLDCYMHWLSHHQWRETPILLQPLAVLQLPKWIYPLPPSVIVSGMFHTSGRKPLPSSLKLVFRSMWKVQVRHMLKPLSDFDLQPDENRGTAHALVQDYLSVVKCKTLGVSIHFLKDTQVGINTGHSEDSQLSYSKWAASACINV